MSSLIYTPGVKVAISTENDGIIDISDDLVHGTVSLRENSKHTFTLTMNNSYRKYDGVFTPNDRITIQMKRLSWLQIMSGYLNTVPYYTAFPAPVTISGECTMKIMRNWPWDAKSQLAVELIHSGRDRQAQDGGMASLIPKIMNTVVGWPLEKIHIGRVPSEWFDKFQAVYSRVSADQDNAQTILGTNPIVAGLPVSPSASALGAVGSITTGLGNGTASNGITYTGSDDAFVFNPADIDVVLATIRQTESKNDYRAVNYGNHSGNIATGAYQFVTTTWNNYGGVTDAYQATNAVQDQRATADVLSIFSRYGNRIVNIPYGWYFPKVFSHPELLDVIPAPEQHNTATIRQYGHIWMTNYVKMYHSMRNGAEPPSQSGATSSSGTPSVLVSSPTLPKANANAIVTGGKVAPYSPQTSIGLTTTQPGIDGLNVVRTLDDVFAKRSAFVTLQGDPSFYNKKYVIPFLVYIDSGGTARTLSNVTAFVHDTGAAFTGKPEGNYGIAVGTDYAIGQIISQTFQSQIELRITATTGATVAATASQSSSYALYPIPAGISALDDKTANWGGYTNGLIPPSAMTYTSRTGIGNPSAVASFQLLLAAGDAAGFDFSGAMYRTLAAQVAGAASSSLFAQNPGHSMHGWGLAIDITILTGSSKKYHLASRNDYYNTDEYKWLVANAARWGWGHPKWAQIDGGKPEPWHWEFLAFPNFKNSTAPAPGQGAAGSIQGPAGANPFTVGAGFNGGPIPGAGFGSVGGIGLNQLFNSIAFWNQGNDEIDQYAQNYYGLKAPMNDTPIWTTISDMTSVAGRSFCAAPNGDFIAWFPDYWGEFGTAGRLNLELVELQDFSVTWSDDSLITHQYVEGAMNLLDNFGPLPGSAAGALSGFETYGVATVEIPRFLEALVNVQNQKYPWLTSSDALLNRFGARVSRVQIATIQGHAQEFWYAVQLFAQAWAAQFTAHVPMTFMPELFPGMLLAIPDLGVQFYVTQVEHEFDMSNEQGFTTTASVMSPSSLDGSGFFLFAKAGKPVRKQPDTVHGDRIVFS